MYCEYKKRRITGRDLVREKVRQRDDYTCQDCGSIRTPKSCIKFNKKNFDVHHINGLCGKRTKGYDRLSEMSGLITLCHKCHYNRHDKSDSLKKMATKNITRDKKIVSLISGGLKQKDVAVKYDMSHQRVSQIFQKYNC